MRSKAGIKRTAKPGAQYVEMSQELTQGVVSTGAGTADLCNCSDVLMA